MLTISMAFQLFIFKDISMGSINTSFSFQIGIAFIFDEWGGTYTHLHPRCLHNDVIMCTLKQ
jgi:hypothetical protein